LTFLGACVALQLAATPAIGAASVVEQANALVRLGQYNEALQKLDDYLVNTPQDVDARFSRALLLVRLNHVPEAISAFTDLTRDYPRLPEPYNNLAVLYAQQGDYDKARETLQAVLAMHPGYTAAQENLGDVYAALAGQAYNRALAQDQVNQGLHHKLSLIDQINSSASSIATAKPSAATPPK
jgi:tetratricopeptide (TPR) repeat protein